MILHKEDEVIADVPVHDSLRGYRITAVTLDRKDNETLFTCTPEALHYWVRNVMARHAPPQIENKS